MACFVRFLRHRWVTENFLKHESDCTCSWHEGPSFLCIQPVLRPAVARRLQSKNGVDGDGKCFVQKLPASLEQLAFISYCVSPFILPSFICFPDWAAELDDHVEPPL